MQHRSTLTQHGVHLRGADYSPSHMTAQTAAPAVGTRRMYGVPPPRRSPTCPGDLPPSPGSRRPHMGRGDCSNSRRGPPPLRELQAFHRRSVARSPQCRLAAINGCSSGPPPARSATARTGSSCPGRGTSAGPSPQDGWTHLAVARTGNARGGQRAHFALKRDALVRVNEPKQPSRRRRNAPSAA
jgi:hypothetical protein